MTTLRTYVTRAFLTTFIATVLVLTFIISIGGLFRITDLLARGVSAGPILRVFLSGLPNGMIYAIPVGTLTAALLVFGRLSGDCEVTAMRACGISIVRVASWFFPFSLLASLACMYANSEWIPLQHYERWRATSELRADAALSLVEVGRTVTLSDDLRIFVGAIREDGTMEQIRIFDQRDGGRLREIKAERGVLEDAPEGNVVFLAMERVTIDPFQFDSPGAAYSERWRVELAQRSGQVYMQRDKHRNFHDLFVMSRLLTMQADNLEHAALLRERVALLRMEAEAEAASIREQARQAFEGNMEEVERWQQRAAEIRAADTAENLRTVAERAAAEAQAALQLAEEQAAAREAEPARMVRVLDRQARFYERSVSESAERLRERAMDMRIILNQRLLISFSPMLFLYFGIPMGIRPHRRESSVGIAASLVAMFLFYIVLTLFGELKAQPQLRPDLLVWIPGVIVLCLDVILLRRMR
jgi:lipopolysaccharide export LptBFGC system permease protein LptF